MPLLRSGLVLALGNGMGSPGLTRAASRDLHNIHASDRCAATMILYTSPDASASKCSNSRYVCCDIAAKLGSL